MQQAPTPPSTAAETPETLTLEVPDWIPQEVVDVWTWIDSVPILGFVVIILLSMLVAKIVEIIFRRGLRRLTAKTSTDLDDAIILLLDRPVFNTVLFVGLALAIVSLKISPFITDITLRLLFTILVLIWLRAAMPMCRLVLDLLSRYRERFPLIEERTMPLFDMVAKLVTLGAGAYALLLIWGIDPTAWLASAGVIGIAVGFAAKDTLANLFSGFFILADTPYKIGDWVVLDSGERGRVTHVGIRSTRLLTRDDIEITLPNAIIANAKIINESGGPWEKERIRIPVGVAYGSDVDQVCDLLQQIAVGHEHICPDPEPRVRMRAFGASSLDFELLCWIDEPVLRGRLRHELFMEVYKAFNAAGIEIPYAKQDVYIKEMPSPLPPSEEEAPE